MRQWSQRVVWLFVLMLCVAGVASAQDCPANILLTLARTGAVCRGLPRDTACYGGGAMTAQVRSGVFAVDGDRLDAEQIDNITSVTQPTWSAALLNLQLSLTDVNQSDNVALLYGAATWRNLVPVATEFLVDATAEINIRAVPLPDAEILRVLPVMSSVLAHGRTADNRWIRVTIPQTNRVGWVTIDSLSLDNDINALTVYDEAQYSDPRYLPFQISTLQTAVNDAPCDGAPNSGLLLQTPNTQQIVRFNINGLQFDAFATLWLQATPDEMLVTMLYGNAEVAALGGRTYVPAGARLRVPLGADGLVSVAPSNAEPLDSAAIATLPLDVLAYRFPAVQPLDQTAINTRVTNFYTVIPTPTPIPPTSPLAPCRYVVLRDTQLRAGAGEVFELSSTVSAGSTINPVLQAVDPEGATWYQLSTGSWIAASAVTVLGGCSPLPFAEVAPPPPTNTLRLENCETDNGPIRAGQQVTIQFIPPAYETLVEAQEAPRIDGGRVLIDNTRLRAQASNVIQIAEERYIRIYSATWTACAGKFRIMGDRLDYEIICSITVDVG
jgi:hypothetical protein